MKYVLIVATMLTAGMAVAQKDPKTPEERAKMQTEKLNSQVQLTSDQQSKIYEINLKEISATDAVRNDSSLSDDQKREKMKSIHQSRQDSYNQVLTADQQTKLKEAKADMREQHGERRGVGMAQKTPEDRAKMMTDKMTTDLSLTDDQSAKIYQINLAHAQKADSIRGNASLSEDEKKAQLETLRKGQREEYQSVLTKEQQAKLKEMKEEQKEEHQQGKKQTHGAKH